MKYMGSKSRIAKYIVPIIQKYIDDNNIVTYIEPFGGGMNVIDKIKCKYKIGTDNNKYLIALLNRVKEGKPLLDSVSREFYNEVRNNKDKYEDWVVGNVAYLASFNGKGFNGGYAKSGYEKTKSGVRYRDYYQESKRNLLKQSDNFKDIVFECCDYRGYNNAILDNMITNCLFYCDIPYESTTGYDSCNEFNYTEFWENMRLWSKNNIVIISEQSAPDDFTCIWEQDVSRSLNANRKSRATEKLFIYNK